MVTTDRAFLERRSGKERRRKMQIQRFFFKGLERRSENDRRENEERRRGWIRVSKWSSAPLAELKIGKFLKVNQ
ncbi:MAG: hypothetical protein PVI45_14905, partial [Desulfobacterales bacterium]|jgi:hypothetical protein